MDNSQVMRLSAMAFLTQFCFLLGYPTSWRTYHQPPLFQPGPQFCPDTGRTVCTAVDYYPTDQIFHLLMSSRSQLFNLTSLFVDERKGDIEPNIAQLPTPQPPYKDGYGVNQPPPGGRFSPAGYNNWNNPTSIKPPPAPPGLQPDRWRQIGQSQGNNNSPPNTGVSQNTYQSGNGRQSRAQGSPNNPGDANTVNNPPLVTQRFNYNDRSKQRQDNILPYGVTQYNRVDPQLNMNYGNQQSFGQDNITRYYPQDNQQQDPYQIQSPQLAYSVKGNNPYTGVTMRPQTARNWKGSPAFSQKSGVLQNSGFNSGRRERRNEDVEVACDVRSTYVNPRAALSDSSEWKYIVNVPERDRRFIQVIRVDICLNPGDPCSSRLSLPFGFESRCRQKYIKKKLLSLNPDGQGTSEDNFFIPSCCVCEIVRQDQKK